MGQHTGEECFPLQLDQGKTTVARPWHKVLWFGLPQVVTDAKILLVHGKFKAQKDLCFKQTKGSRFQGEKSGAGQLPTGQTPGTRPVETAVASFQI